jgi:hypothetical protein
MTQQEHLQRIRQRCVELLTIWDGKRDHNLIYTASCAGAAEAGWRATISAIDWLDAMDWHTSERISEQLIAAWPEELL